MTPVERMNQIAPDWRVWLLGFLATTALMLAGWVYSSLSTRLEAQALQVQRASERLAAAEATQYAIQRQLDSDIRELREGVKSLSTKLDRLIEDRRGR